MYVNLFSQTEVNGNTKSLFKIVVEDNITHHKYIGYSGDKSRNNVEIFVNYVLSNLEMRGGLDKNYKLFTGRNLISHESEQTSKTGILKKAKVIKDNLSHKDILGRIYKELIFNEGYAEIEGYTETKNPILPPLFVDSFIRDFDKITKLTDYWRNQKINDNDNKIFKDTLREVANEVEKYQDNFDFDKAIKFYKRLNIAAAELADSEKLSAQFLLKQVKIYFHLEQYDKCKEMIETNLKKFENIKLKNEVGELYYYLGMMSSYSNKIKDADEYFSRSSRMLTKTTEHEKTYIYYRSRIRRFILKKDYESAVTMANKALRKTFENNDLKELCYLYGIKSEIYFLDRKYTLAEDNLKIQLEYAVQSKDYVSESKCLAQIIQLLTFQGIIDEIKIKKELSRIQTLSKIIKKNSYYYDSLMCLGVFCYRNNRVEDAERYFNRASRIYTADTTDAASHIVNMIYLAKIRIAAKNYLSATRLLIRMLKMCEYSNVLIYPAYIYNSLGRIYFEKQKHNKSILFLNKAIKLIETEKIKDNTLKANTLRFIGLNYRYTGIKTKAEENFIKSLKLLRIINRDSGSDVKDVILEVEAELSNLR